MLAGNAGLVVEADDAQFRFTERGNIRLFFQRDSIGNLCAKYILYIADSSYHIRKQGRYENQDFTGALLVFKPDGRISDTLMSVDGRIVSKPSARLIEGFTNTNGFSYRCTGYVRTYLVEVACPADCGCSKCAVEVTDCVTSSGGGGSQLDISSFVFGFSRSGYPDIGGDNQGGTSLNLFSEADAARRILVDIGQLSAVAARRLEEVNYREFLNLAALLLADGTAATQFAQYYYSGLMTGALSPMGDDLRGLYNVITNAGITNQVTFKKVAKVFKTYIQAGFDESEFTQLIADQVLFQQVNPYLTSNNFNEESIKYVRTYKFLLEINDSDFVTLNQNRGNRTIKELLDEYGTFDGDKWIPTAGTLIALAKENGVDVALPGNFTKLGRIMEDFVMRSLGIPKNTTPFADPNGARTSVIPDGLGDGNVAQYEMRNGSLQRTGSWLATNSIFFDSKFTAKGTKLIQDNVTTNANGTPREQLSTMIDVLAQMKGVYIDNVINASAKATNHGIASLYIITLYDVDIDPNLITQAVTNNVNVYKRWITYDPKTKKMEVSGGYRDLTPTILTRKSPGHTDPMLLTSPVDIDWTIR